MALQEVSPDPRLGKLYPVAASAGRVPVFDGDRLEYVAPRVLDFSRPPYSMDLTGSTDMTAELQGLMGDADAHGYGAIAYMPWGRLRISETITWPIGVLIEGGYGSGNGGSGSKVFFPRIMWAGDSADNMFEVPDNASAFGVTWQGMRRMTLYAVGGFTAKNGIVFNCRADIGTTLEDVSMGNYEEYGIRFEQGGINVHFERFRIDGSAKHAVYWKIGGVDSLSFNHYTIDGSNLSSASGGALYVDGSSITPADQWTLRFSSRNGKIENNYNLTGVDANFEFHVNPDNNPTATVYATFEDTWVAPGSSVTDRTGVLVSPDSDMQTIILQNCQMSVAGVPSYTDWERGGDFHTLTIIAPNRPDLNVSPATRQQAANVIGELNVGGRLSMFGKVAAPLVSLDTATDLAGTSLFAGDMVMDPSTRTSGHRTVKEVTVQGTLGTLTGVTATGTTGTNTMVVNDASDLRVGQNIVVAASPTQFKVIRKINGTTVMVSSNFNASFTDAAVSYNAPTVRSGQFIPIIGSKTWNTGTVGTGAQVNTTVTVTGAALGDYVTVSHTGGVPGGCTLTGSVTATNTVTVTFVNHSGSNQSLTGTIKARVTEV